MYYLVQINIFLNLLTDTSVPSLNYGHNVGATSTDKYSSWRATTLAREWSGMQTMRRVSPGYTVTLALLVLHVSTETLAQVFIAR